jgi:cell division protease FtsH
VNKNGNNKKWRNAGLYALLLIVVLALASAFFDRQPTAQKSWKYSEFLQEVRAGKVEAVRLSADRARAIVPAQDGTQVFVNLPNDPQLINILAENNVDISVLPQKEEGIWVRAFSSLFFPHPSPRRSIFSPPSGAKWPRFPSDELR